MHSSSSHSTMSGPPEAAAPPARLPDWPARLSQLVALRLTQPFRWGPNDCAAFTADAVAAMTGVDVLAELRGSRRTKRQALRQIVAIGGVQAAIERAGLQRIAPAMAGRGDVVMLRQGREQVLAVCVGGSAVAPGSTGLEHRGMDAAMEAWRL